MAWRAPSVARSRRLPFGLAGAVLAGSCGRLRIARLPQDFPHAGNNVFTGKFAQFTQSSTPRRPTSAEILAKHYRHAEARSLARDFMDQAQGGNCQARGAVHQ